MRFCDPEGNLVELVAGVDSVTEPYGNRDVKPVGLNHVVLEAKDRVALESFYRDALGFKLTDQLADFMTFFRCNANHHSLAFLGARDGVPGFNHAAFEIRNWEEWIKAVFYAGEKGIPRVWGPGPPPGRQQPVLVLQGPREQHRRIHVRSRADHRG